MFRKLLCGVLAIGMAGCSLDEAITRSSNKEVFRNQRASVVDLDASRRGVIANWALTRDVSGFVPIRGELGKDEPVVYLREMRVCAEQFPDIFTVAATQLSANASADVDPDSVAASLALAASRSESGTTIQRTQTVNLLREMMYRTCERFMSGAIGADELAVQASRDVRAMVSVLAIEQLTGSISSPPSIIGATSQGSATAGSLTAMAAVIEEKNDAEEAVAAAQTAATTALQDNDNCDAVPTANDERKTCEEAQASLAASKARLVSAEQAMEVTVAAVAQQVESQASVTSTSPTQSKITAQVDLVRAQAVTAVAETVEEIVRMNMASADGSVPCEVILLRDHNGAGKPSFNPSHSGENVVETQQAGRELSAIASERSGDWSRIQCNLLWQANRNVLAGSSQNTDQSGNETRRTAPSGDIAVAEGRGVDFIVGSSQAAPNSQAAFDAAFGVVSRYSSFVWDFPSYADGATPSRVQVEYYRASRVGEAAFLAQALQSASTSSQVCLSRGDYFESPGAGAINISLPDGFSVNQPDAAVDTDLEIPSCPRP